MSTFAIVVAASFAVSAQTITSAAAVTIASGNGGSQTVIPPTGVVTPICPTTCITTPPVVVSNPILTVTRPSDSHQKELDTDGHREVEHHKYIEHVQGVGVKK